jgi:hypothetical protein
MINNQLQTNLGSQAQTELGKPVSPHALPEPLLHVCQRKQKTISTPLIKKENSILHRHGTFVESREGRTSGKLSGKKI